MPCRIALCIDDATRFDLDAVGLGGQAIDAQPWLEVCTCGDDARRRIREQGDIGQVWVVSCDDVDPINLAATAKADRPDVRVVLFARDRCGSLLSRAHAAGIDEVSNLAGLPEKFAAAKAHGRVEASQGAPSGADGAATNRACGHAGSAGAYAGGPVACSRSSEGVAGEGAATGEPSPVGAGGRAFLLPVVSGSGGAGKSSVAVAGAFVARAMGYRTLLLDYDLQFGDAAAMAGFGEALAIDEALAHPDLLDRELRRDGGLSVIAAPSRLESAEGVVSALPEFLDQVAGSFDVIVANTGAAWAEQHAALLERCSAALFLVDQRASSVRACRHALELCARCGIASGPFQFALNRCAKNAPLTSADVTSALQGAPVFEIRDGGRDVEDYLGAGAAQDLIDARNEFCASLEHVMSSLLPASPDMAPQSGQLAPKAARKRGRHVMRKRGRGMS